MKITALIDGDELIYKSGYAGQRTVYEVYVDQEEEDGWIAIFPRKRDAIEWVNNQEDLIIVPRIVVGPLHAVIHNVDSRVATILRRSGAHEPAICFSHHSNFRYDCATFLPYKGNRSKDARPDYYHQIKHHLETNYPYIELEYLEADDVMGIIQTLNTEDTIICSQDKDMLMIPGKNYNPNNGKITHIYEDDANRFFFTQMLTGDMTDNIPGLYQLTGTRVLAKYKKPLTELHRPSEMYEYVRSVYINAFNCENEENDVDKVLSELGELLWIKRDFFKGWKDILNKYEEIK